MAAIAQLIEAEIPRLRRYARALTRGQEGADDLVQETLLRALEKTHLWQVGTNLRAWLFTLLHNNYVNTVRRSARQGHRVDVEFAGLTTPAHQQRALELRDLERAIARLPEDQRTALLLIALEGMKYEEAAAVLGVPVGTIRSRLSRAREALRQMLDGTVQELGLPVGAFQRGAPAVQPAYVG